MKFSKGFTIIEMVVVMAIFIFVITAVFGIFLSVVQSQRRVLSEQQLLSQISYAQEYMSKALRMATVDASGNCLGTGNAGYIYLLTDYDSSASVFKGVKFFNQTDNACEKFFVDNAVYGQTSTPLVLKQLKNNADVSTAIALTSSALQINSVRFSVNGSSGSTFAASGCPSPNTTQCGCPNTLQCGACYCDAVQPRVTISMNVAISGESVGSCVAGACSAGQSCVSGVCAPNRIFQITVSQRNLNVNNGQR
ncbi:MAG: type II secretion system protein [Candidatus Staskawiczbacteria bacterium]|nr:type II secretion system protein [Candidatus Staskawiczbacteria bacterium]